MTIKVNQTGMKATVTLDIHFDGDNLNQQDFIDIVQNQMREYQPEKTITGYDDDGKPIEEKNPNYIDYDNLDVEKAICIIFEKLCKTPFANNFAHALRQEKIREQQKVADTIAQGMVQYIQGSMTLPTSDL